jgi:hypothetical protein
MPFSDRATEECKLAEGFAMLINRILPRQNDGPSDRRLGSVALLINPV